ncbi:MAG: hypothetical protein J6S78_01135 [Lachnospiraceae bacterium]|nr:hypothetical protein [Lachnospiraceae bacterium]
MLHRMTEEEIAIRKIKNLRMVSVYEFTSAVPKEGEDHRDITGKSAGCTAVTVLYGEGDQITLSELDPYFDELCERVLEVYAETKDKSSILLDDATRALLEAGASVREATFLDSFYAMTGSEIAQIHYDACLGRRFLPVVSYLVGELETLLDDGGEVVDRTFGWRGRGTLVLRRRNGQTTHPLITERIGPDDYRVSVGDYPEIGENMQVDVSVQTERMEIAFAAERSDFTGRFQFRFLLPYMEMKVSVSRGGAEICYENNRYTAGEPEEPGEAEQKLLPDTGKPDVVYHLPFGMKYVLTDRQETSGDIRRDDYTRTLLYGEAAYSETVSWSIVRNTKTGVMIRKNNIRMMRSGFEDGRTQTYFDPIGAGAPGRYRTALAGRYFIQ